MATHLWTATMKSIPAEFRIPDLHDDGRDVLVVLHVDVVPVVVDLRELDRGDAVRGPVFANHKIAGTLHVPQFTLNVE